MPAALLGRIVLLAVVYFLAARAGLLLAIPPGYATAVWPPSGIALAALLLLGPRMWPGILLGAMLANLSIQGSVLLAVLIGLGNTLEAVVAAGFVRRFVSAQGEFDNGESAVAFVMFAAVSAFTAAFIGCAALFLTGTIEGPQFAPNLFVWLQGDASGMIVFTPLILAWRLRPWPVMSPPRWLEAVALGAAVLVVATLTFSNPGLDGALQRLTFITFPLVIWAAIRFGQRGVTTTAAALSSIAAWYTLPGKGPLVLGAAPEISFYMLFYIGALVVTGLVLRAVIGQRRRAEEAVRERVRELQESERRVNEFLAMLSHELRNPLASIVNAVAIMQKQQAAVPRMADIIERQTTHLVHIVGDLLDVSRITRGKIRLTRAPADLKVIVLRMLESTLPLVESRRHSVELVPASESLAVEVDATRISQVMLNLISNAAKYTPPGGHISIALSRERDEVVARVRDDGIGIAPELLPKIFDLFTQGDHSLDRSEGGLGIGLTIARRIVELHGGTLRASSEGLGKGSLFEVRLPAALGAATGEPAPAAVMAPAPRRRVLVVDDNRDSADSMAILLRAMGHEVEKAYDGPAALELAARQRPEVVLLDIGLPGMDGYEVARALRSAPGGADLTLIAVTGYGQEEDRVRSLEAGFDRHLVKPVEPKELEEEMGKP